MGFTLDVSFHVLAFADESAMLLTGLEAQIFLLGLLHLELLDSLLQFAQVPPIHHQSLAQVRWH